MNIIQDKLGNEFLRSSGMEHNFPHGMLMFSHLPPVNSFNRLSAQPVLPDAPQNIIFKKEPHSPPERTSSDFMQSMVGIKQEKICDQDLFRFYGSTDKNPGIAGVTVSSQNMFVQDLSLGRDASTLTDKGDKDIGVDPKEDGSAKKEKRQHLESQEVKQKRKRSDSSKQSSPGDGEVGSFSPGQKPHICEHCSAAFRSSYHLRRHVLIHTGERPFQCSQCSMSFIQKYLLQRHEKIHSGEKPFSCDQCNMRFIQKYHMERHKRTHSGEKPYRCDTCQQYFSRTDRLLKHKRSCGEAIRKVESGMEPGPSDQNSIDNGDSSFQLTQGHTSASIVRKKKSKAASGDKERKKDKNVESDISSSLNMQNYAVEIPMVSSSNNLVGTSTQQVQARVPKLVFKKVHRKSPEKTDLNLISQGASDLVNQKLLPGKEGSLELPNSTGMENLGLLHSTDNKPNQTSSNYDDAMQFLKKRRYLQAANNNDYAVNVGHMASQQSVIQAAVASVMDSDTSLSLLDSSSLNTDIKSCHDKSGIPDEVLQSLLEHYHKSEGHPDVSFDMTEQHVNLHPTGGNSELEQDDSVCTDSHAPSGDKNNMLHEYSKYLQQALERTSHSSGFALGPSLQFVSLTSTLTSHTLFPDKQMYTTSPLECSFSQSVTSVLPAALPKSHFGMLVGPSQSGFPLTALDAAHQQLTPSQELTDQIEQQKNLEPSSNYQLTSQELTSQKEQQKSLEPSSSYQLSSSQELSSQLDTQKILDQRAVYQIENFAQAFGSQFKTGSRVPVAYSTNSNGEVDHRIRTQVSEFSGYTNLLSDVSETVSTRAKTPTSQSYR
ncbi:zinc finger protein 281 [Protopterus annectens]|uniref:zinc finger protein 281 n=1 Tax=Protopterus annectens TaxID=7888 RepID=UPI001CFA20AF|nr:zinc finger protein 281 [Protopterus annectens]XP_043911275.1 zinc finger protein 281 [Protopterus annectens]XP_043911276.1 zinc finger protein 281 [Protopterus annectens]XP_043911278.1 zinc finger protein 281 [Protopterus annectens]XP_043911279.1 zinc finger protein 281 [Protopterus annectens]